MTTAQEYLVENAPDLYQATLAVLEDSHQALKWRDEKIEEQARTIEEQNRHYQDLENVAVSQKISRDERIATLEERNKELERVCAELKKGGQQVLREGVEASHRIEELEARNKELEGLLRDCADEVSHRGTEQQGRYELQSPEPMVECNDDCLACRLARFASEKSGPMTDEHTSMKFEIWDHCGKALVLLPFPDGGRPDTDGPEWSLLKTFEASSFIDAQMEFDRYCHPESHRAAVALRENF